ncbi:hypothetical protein [Pseudonocardia alaniniphila]|uniref:Uncharacterized protein n=1 Tax=Pseudonocardia alaniniphila TaxID=75291 RepID=A0ABS9TLX3_9PSEU|nr:hypothetical protein [Pseudonocardia alaniniphila]MCH6169503.1 hypothetical protein [Pseudonocardia alaniniphila]
MTGLGLRRGPPPALGPITAPRAPAAAGLLGPLAVLLAVTRGGPADPGGTVAAIGPLSRGSPIGAGSAAAAITWPGPISLVGAIAAPAPPLPPAIRARGASPPTGRSASSRRAELGHRHLAAGTRELRGVEEGNRSRCGLPRTLGRSILAGSIVGGSVVGCERGDRSGGIGAVQVGEVGRRTGRLSRIREIQPGHRSGPGFLDAEPVEPDDSGPALLLRRVLRHRAQKSTGAGSFSASASS